MILDEHFIFLKGLRGYVGNSIRHILGGSCTHTFDTSEVSFIKLSRILHHNSVLSPVSVSAEVHHRVQK